MLVMHCSHARAASVAFSTFGLGDCFVSNAGEGISGPSGQFGEVDKAMVFPVTGTSWLLTQVEFPFSYLNGTDTVALTIRTDAGRSPSGMVLESVTFTVPQSLFTIATVTLSGTTQIDPGSTYWLALSMPDNGFGAWLFTSPQVVGPRAGSTNGGTSWTIEPLTQSAFRLTGIPVPEPSGAALFTGVLLVLLRHNRPRLPGRLSAETSLHGRPTMLPESARPKELTDFERELLREKLFRNRTRSHRSSETGDYDYSSDLPNGCWKLIIAFGAFLVFCVWVVGVAWQSFRDGVWILAIVAAAIIIPIVLWLEKKRGSQWVQDKFKDQFKGTPFRIWLAETRLSEEVARVAPPEAAQRYGWSRAAGFLRRRREDEGAPRLPDSAAASSGYWTSIQPSSPANR